MKLLFSSRFQREYKKFIKKHPELETTIQKTLQLLKENPNDKRLMFKKINCKRDKYRHSARVLNTQYRILLTVVDDVYELRHLLDHDAYDRVNKDC